MRQHNSPATSVAAGALVVSAMLAAAVPAAADPMLPSLPDGGSGEPASPSAPPVPSSGTASTDPAASPAGAPPPAASVPDPYTNVTNPLNVLGQRPAAPGTVPPPPVSLNSLNNAYLLPQNLVPSAPGQGTVVGVAPGQENADTSFRKYLSRLRDQYRNGGLAGAMLGRRPPSELDAPPPDTAEPVMPAQPAAPEVVSPAPPFGQ